jgi:hypothetical protein
MRFISWRRGLVSQISFTIEVVGSTSGAIDRYAGELQSILQRSAPDTNVQRHRQDPSTMDAGSIIAVIVNAPAAIVVAKALGDYITKRNVVLKIKEAEGTRELELSGIGDPEPLARAFLDSIAKKAKGQDG